MLIFILEAAIRSLLMASVVWAATRLLRVQAVFAQKVTWVLVLAAAGAMPLLMHAPWLAMSPAVRIPLRSLAPSPSAVQPRLNLTQSAFPAVAKTRTVHPVSAARKAKPSAAHRTPGQDAFVDSRITTGSHALQAPTSRIPDTPERIVSLIESPQTVPTGLLFLRRHLGSIVLGLYLAGVVLLLVRVLVGLAIAFRLWRRAEPKSGLASPSSVRISRDLATPVTIGSTVILPSNYGEWEEDKLRIVLAHEQAHVRQADFYLQLLAALYVSVTWFSPLGWWLQRKLSELGEALSDRAGLEQAPSAASYAQVLLEFAALPRPTVPLAGVAMARSSNLSSRIEHILNDRGVRLSFLDGRRHALVAAALVPVALVAVVALIRIEPAVAAQVQATSSATTQSSTQPDATSSTTAQASGQMNTSMTGDVSGQVTADAAGQEATQSETVITPIAPQAPAAPLVPERPAAAAPEPPEPAAPAPEVEAPEPPEPANGEHRFAYSYSDDGQDSFAIIHGKDSTVSMSGRSGKELEKVRQKVHGDFIWFERDGKSYVITDPSILAQSEAMFHSNPELKREQDKLKARQDELNRRMAELNAQNRPRTEAMNRLQAQLGAKQGEISRQMAQFNRDMAKMQFDSPEMKREMAELNAQIAKSQLNSPEMKREMAEMSAEIAKAQIDSPEMKKQMAELNEKLAELQSDKLKKLTEDLNKNINSEVLSEIQEKMGDIQGQIGEIQGSIGEEMGKFGEKQGELGERMGELGEEMGRIGEQQGKQAEEASRKVKSLIDKAYKEGKAKPVDPQ